MEDDDGNNDRKENEKEEERSQEEGENGMKEESSNLKRERADSPSEERETKREKHMTDEFGRTIPDSTSEIKNRSRSPSKSPSRSPERSRERDSRRYRRERRERERSWSPEKRRDSPPQKRRRRKEDDWEEKDYPEGRGSPERHFSYQDKRDKRMRRKNSPIDEIGDKRGNKQANMDMILYGGSMKSMKQFLDIQGKSISSGDEEKKYEEYKEEYKKRQAKNFFEEHKDEEWFKEKYEPSYLSKTFAEKIKISKENQDNFASDLKEGNLEFDLKYEGEEPEKEREGDPDSKETKSEFEDQNVEEMKTEEPLEEGEKLDDEEKSSPKLSSKSDKTDSSKKTAIDPTTLFIKNIPPTCGKSELIEVFKQSEGFRYLTISEPMKFKNFIRLGWATYDSKENCSAALDKLNGYKFKDFDLQITRNKPSTDPSKRIKITPAIASEESRILKDHEQSKQLCLSLDNEKNLKSNPLLEDEGFSNLSTIEQLDRMIFYLRKVHFFCYYCGEDYESEEDLIRKCGDKHMRRQKKDSIIPETEENWAKSLDNKVKNRLEHPHKPEIFLGTEEIERSTENFFKQNIQSKEKGRFRCAICNKLFSADHYVKKHLNLKHNDKIEEAKKKALEKQFFDNYFRDPRRIIPTPQTGLIPLPPNAMRTPQMRRFWSGAISPVPGVFYPSMSYFSPNFRGRGRGRGNRRQSFGSPGLLEPPPGIIPDPRSTRDYQDLDAPSEPPVQIDYRTAVDYND